MSSQKIDTGGHCKARRPFSYLVLFLITLYVIWKIQKNNLNAVGYKFSRRQFNQVAFKFQVRE